MSADTLDYLLSAVLFMLSVIGIIMGGMILTAIIGNVCGTYLVIGTRRVTFGYTPAEDTRTQWERDRDDALAELNRELDA